MSLLKRFVSFFPGGEELAARHSFRRREKELERIGDVRDRFTHFFEHNKWANEESRSGIGSTLDATAPLRESLPRLVARRDIRRILDAPCGDYNWMQHVKWETPVDYIGGDIVRKLIEANQDKYARSSVRFVELNLIEDKLPSADLLLCRDCLIHFSYEDIWRTLRNFVDSDIDLFLLSDFPELQVSRDIPTGHCRFLNLQLPPIALPEPIESLSDPGVGEPAKRLSLWSRAQLLDALTEFDKRRDNQGQTPLR